MRSCGKRPCSNCTNISYALIPNWKQQVDNVPVETLSGLVAPSITPTCHLAQRSDGSRHLPDSHFPPTADCLTDHECHCFYHRRGSRLQLGTRHSLVCYPRFGYLASVWKHTSSPADSIFNYRELCLPQRHRRQTSQGWIVRRITATQWLRPR